MIAEFLRLANIARALTTPGEPNEEYIRGQVNLIMEATRTNRPPEIPADIYKWLTSYISEGYE